MHSFIYIIFRQEHGSMMTVDLFHSKPHSYLSFPPPPQEQTGSESEGTQGVGAVCGRPVSSGCGQLQGTPQYHCCTTTTTSRLTTDMTMLLMIQALFNIHKRQNWYDDMVSPWDIYGLGWRVERGVSAERFASCSHISGSVPCWGVHAPRGFY